MHDGVATYRMTFGVRDWSRLFAASSLLVVGFGCQTAETQPPRRSTPATSTSASSVAPKTPERSAEPSKAPPIVLSGDAKTSEVSAATSSTPEKNAEVWLDTIATKDVGALAKLTRLPFVLFDPALPKNCRSRVAKDAAALTSALNCVIGSKFLVEDVAFPYNKPHTGFLISDKDTPTWAKRWQKEIGIGVVPIGIGLMGAGVFHEIVILSNPDGVHGLWRKQAYDPR